MLERTYQSNVIAKLRIRFPGCVILKNDSDYLPGIPDLTILYRAKWGMLEVKAYKRAFIQPNQEYYISQLNDMSFAAFIYPENEEEVFDGLQQALES
jgi:hypothetical protein